MIYVKISLLNVETSTYFVVTTKSSGHLHQVGSRHIFLKLKLLLHLNLNVVTLVFNVVLSFNVHYLMIIFTLLMIIIYII
jgi:hypothetical protein